MNHRDLVVCAPVRAPDVGMGVGLAGAPVGRPPSMTHTAASLGKMAVSLPDGDRQVIERAYLPDDLDSRFGEGQGKPCRVITSVLEVSQTLHEYLHAPLSAGVTDDSAHKQYLRPRAIDYLIALYAIRPFGGHSVRLEVKAILHQH